MLLFLGFWEKICPSISNCWLIQVLSNDLQFYEKPFQCLYCVHVACDPSREIDARQLSHFFPRPQKIQYYYLEDSMLTFQSYRQNTESYGRYYFAKQ